MAETEKKEVLIDGVSDNDPVPYFKIGASPFYTGISMHSPGDVIPWQVPEGWKEKENGKHFASHGPSLTWTPLNKAAKKLMDAHKENVAKKNAPKPDPAALRLAALEEAFNRQAEAQNKQAEMLAAILEKLVGKK